MYEDVLKDLRSISIMIIFLSLIFGIILVDVNLVC